MVKIKTGKRNSSVTRTQARIAIRITLGVTRDAQSGKFIEIQSRGAIKGSSGSNAKRTLSQKSTSSKATTKRTPTKKSTSSEPRANRVVTKKSASSKPVTKQATSKRSLKKR